MTADAPGTDPWADFAVAGPTEFSGWPGFDRLLFLTYGVRFTSVLYAVTELDIADLLADGPRGTADLAERTGTVPDLLGRVLRTAAAVGLVAEQPDGRWSLTEVSERLRTDLPDSLHDLIMLSGHPMMWRPYGELLSTLRSGVPAFEHVFGKPFYEYLEGHPDHARVFGDSMVQRSQLVAERIARTAELGRFGSIVDVAGGNGYLLAEVLRQYPGVRGVLFEQPWVLPEARRLFADLGLHERVRFEAGDFFQAVPAGHDAYLLKAVLHNWPDADAVAILRRVREALGSDGRVLIVEKVLAGRNEWDYSKLIDIDMMMLMGGRERDLADWVQMIESAGMRMVDYPGTGRSPWTYLECARA